MSDQEIWDQNYREAKRFEREDLYGADEGGCYNYPVQDDYWRETASQGAYAEGWWY